MPEEWGTWVIALVPISDLESGKVIALLGMDIDAADRRNTLLLSIRFPLLLTLIAAAVWVGGQSYLHRKKSGGASGTHAPVESGITFFSA